MAAPKKGQLMQFMVPMVDSTDFASVESAITESDFNSGATVKFYGVNVGSSAAFTSGTVSKTARLVRSGVFQICLKGTENSYDQMMVRINKVGCAERIVTWDTVDNDDSDIYSMLSDLVSDFQSRVPKAVATNSQVSDLASDLRSYLVGLSATSSDIYSLLSDTNSDLRSLIDTTGVALNASAMSDIRSAINAITASVSASDISDIASAVRATLVSDLSDILSAAQQVNSRVLVNQSRVSDLQSFMSDMQSDLISHIDTTGVQLNASTMSDLRSAINAITVTISASDVSDIASAVVAGLPIASVVSDIYSLLQAGVSLDASTMSDLRSAITATELDASDLSDIASAVRTIVSSDLSDIISAIAQVNSRVVVNRSMVSDIQSFLSDMQSDLMSHLDTTGVGLNASVMSDLRSAITAGPTDVQLNASSLSDLRSHITANGVLRAGADPTTVVGVTGTLAEKVDWLTAMSRNKLTQTATVASLRNDNDSADIASAAVSDDGAQYTRAEWS